MSPAPDLSVIIISYNTKAMTLEAIASLRAHTETPHEIVVIDNASTDGSAAAIAKAFPDITLITETDNHGFGPAHAIAIPHCTAPWLLLLNPDTVVLDGAVDTLMTFAKAHPDNGIYGGRTLNADGSLNPMSCFGRMTLWSTAMRVLGLNAIFRKSTLFNSEYIGDWPRDTVREVDIVSGCFFLTPHAVWDELGGFDDAFFMYGEEADLCMRAITAGYRPIITPDAEIIHYAGASEKVRADKMVRLMRAKTELVKRHFKPGTRRIGMALFALWPLSRRVVTGFAGSVLGNPTLREKAANWAEIWDRRAEWKDGF
jgi:GT2 family glycosyltransferase